MGDLFFLTLRVIVYIPYPHARGKAVQVKRAKESAMRNIKEWGMCSKTATTINHCHPGNHTYNYDELCIFSHWCRDLRMKILVHHWKECGSIIYHKSGKWCSIPMKTRPLNERSEKLEQPVSTTKQIIKLSHTKLTQQNINQSLILTRLPTQPHTYSSRGSLIEKHSK